MTTIITGTSHFTSYHAACAYYAGYGFTPADVNRKIEDDEITIGEPKVTPGDRLIVIDNGWRYATERDEAPTPKPTDADAFRTLAEFRASGVDCADLGATLSFDTGQEEPVKGRVYLGQYYIEDTRSWPDPDVATGRWYLILERSEWQSDDLADLERRLYLYALGEHSAWREQLVDLALDAAAATIQDAIGQTCGDIASHMLGDRAREALRAYLELELLDSFTF